MKRKIIAIAVLLPGMLLLCQTVLAAEVAQGKCVSFDTVAKRIVLDEYGLDVSKENPYGTSTGRASEFDVAAAKIGIPPEPGDILRIAFTMDGATRRAIKVMNVSKQDLRKK